MFQHENDIKKHPPPGNPSPPPKKKQLIFFSTYKADKYAPSVTELTRGGDAWWVGCTS